MAIQNSIICYCQALGAALVVLVGTIFATPGFAQSNRPVQVGTVTMEQVSVAFIGSVQSGNGMVNFQGKTYPFKISGLGVGGIGISKINAYGEVYDMKDIRDFAGGYIQARTGLVVGALGKSSLWLKNSKGVYLRITAKRKGLALSMGADGIVIKLNN